MFTFNPTKWYWIIDGTAIYSSAINSIIPPDNQDYVAWLSYNNQATSVKSSADIDNVLLKYGLPVTGLTPLTTDQLIAYAATKADTIVSTFKVYGSKSKTLKADRTASTLSDLLAIQQDAVANPTDPVAWLANDYTVSNLTAADVAALAPIVAADRKAIYAVASSAVTAIKAGTITTKADVDALAWPT